MPDRGLTVRTRSVSSLPTSAGEMKVSLSSAKSSSKSLNPYTKFILKAAAYGPLFTKNAGYSRLSPIYMVPKLRLERWPPPSSKTMARCYSTQVAVTVRALGRCS